MLASPELCADPAQMGAVQRSAGDRAGVELDAGGDRGSLPSAALLRSAFQYEVEAIRSRSTRCAYFFATPRISSSSPASSVVGLSPSFCSPERVTTSSLLSASRRGLGTLPIASPLRRAIAFPQSAPRGASVNRLT